MSLYAGEFYLCGRKTFVCFSKMPFSAACSAGFRACPRPCDDRLRFCDSPSTSAKISISLTRPCDDRLRFCDFVFFNPVFHNKFLDLVMTACGFVTSLRFHALIIFTSLDLVMTACGFVTLFSLIQFFIINSSTL